MPRRIPDYPDAYAELNHIVSMGSFISFSLVALFLFIVYDMFIGDIFLKSISLVITEPLFG